MSSSRRRSRTIQTRNANNGYIVVFTIEESGDLATLSAGNIYSSYNDRFALGIQKQDLEFGETLPTLHFHGPLVKRVKCTSAQLNRCRPWYKSGVAAALPSLKFLSFRYLTNYAGRTSEFGCSSSMSPSTLDLFYSSAASTAGKMGVKCSKGDASPHHIHIDLYIYILRKTLFPFLSSFWSQEGHLVF